MTDEERIEAGAEAIYETAPNIWGPPKDRPVEWIELQRVHQLPYINKAKKCLEAAGALVNPTDS